MKLMARIFGMVLLASLALFGQTVRTARKARPPEPPYLGASKSIEARVDDLIARMTIEEKASQMQNSAPAIPRLGIPSYDWWSEALHGVARSGHATVFPQAIGMAATWDPDLIFREGRVISNEARAKYNQAQRENNHNIYFGLTFFSPWINILRDPRWGRGQETYGEDPYLTSKIAVAFVKGLQGGNAKYFEAIATPKAFAVHSGPEALRRGFKANPTAHDLEDTYLPAFRATLVDGHAMSVMCAYNALDGAPACANPMLMQGILRDEWKFKGYATSDCYAVDDITQSHHLTPNNEYGAALAVRSGTDITCGPEYVTLPKAVRDGLLTEGEMNTALRRLFKVRFRLGMFDPPAMVPFNKILISEVGSAENRQVALQAARESIVLLKNRGSVLPLRKDVRTIAVIGPNAESLSSIEGNYNGAARKPVLPLDGIVKQLGSPAKVIYAQGSPYISNFPVQMPRSVFHPSPDSVTEGLKGEYFSNLDFSGKPTLTRIDPQIQFDWNAAQPVPGVSKIAFSVRWTGVLTLPGPGDYIFGFDQPFCWPCDGRESIRMSLDDKPVISVNQNSRNVSVPTFKMHSEAKDAHNFKVEYTHDAPVFLAGLTLNWQPPLETLRDQAVSLARAADVILFFGGISPRLEGEEMEIHLEGFNRGDRTDLDLPRAQQDLLEALRATGKPLVLVLMNGTPISVNWANDHAASILEVWYPGEEGGTAIAETIAGINNPGGRLPATFVKSVDQLPPFADYNMAGRTYRYFSGDLLYPFGFGLSYTKFEYSHLNIPNERPAVGEDVHISADVKNTGIVPGDEVVELYVTHPNTTVPVPIRALAGIRRVHLMAGELRHVPFTLTSRELSIVDSAGRRTVEPGEIRISVGGKQPGFNGSADAETTGVLVGSFTLSGSCLPLN